jgi:hypothetical protein
MTAARRPAIAVALAIVCAALLALQRALLETAARLQSPVDLFFDPLRPVTAAVVRSLPYRVIDTVFAPPAWIHVAMIVLAALQTLALYALYRALRDREAGRGEYVALALVAAFMIGVALQAPTVNGFDAYADAGYAKLGLAHAYTPLATPLGNGFGLVNTIWGNPMPPDAQGPGWVALAAATAGRAATVGGAIFTLRVIEVVALLALTALLVRRNRAAIAIPALVALNPALYLTFVVNAHPDLFAVTLAIGAAAAAAAFPILAVVLLACAALIKLPLILLAPAVLVPPRASTPLTARTSAAARLAYIALAALIAVLASLSLGGTPYLARFAAEVRAAFVPAGVTGLIAVAIRCGLVIVAATALVRVFRFGFVRPAAQWSFIVLSPTIAPAAVAWILPYSAQARTLLAASLILFPIATAIFDVSFGQTGLGITAIAAILVYAIIEAIRLRNASAATIEDQRSAV